MWVLLRARVTRTGVIFWKGCFIFTWRDRAMSCRGIVTTAQYSQKKKKCIAIMPTCKSWIAGPFSQVYFWAWTPVEQPSLIQEKKANKQKKYSVDLQKTTCLALLTACHRHVCFSLPVVTNARLHFQRDWVCFATNVLHLPAYTNQCIWTIILPCLCNVLSTTYDRSGYTLRLFFHTPRTRVPLRVRRSII